MYPGGLRANSLAAAWRCLARSGMSMATAPNKSTTFFDVVVAGGGLVGIAMACALGTSPKFANKRVLLLDAKPLKSDFQLGSSYSNRVSAFSPKSRRLLEDVGVWNYICDMRQKAVKHMHIWDACSDAAVTFTPCEHFQDDNIVYVVENNVVVACLLKRIRELVEVERVSLRDSTRVENYEIPNCFSEGPAKVHLQGGEVVETDLLIGSDGIHSNVRKASNIKSIGWDYNQLSIVATLTISPEAEKNDIAWQRFLPGSAIAILPLTDTLSSLVWSVDVADAKRLMAMTGESFVNEVNSALFTNAHVNPTMVSFARTIKRILQTTNQSGPLIRQLPPKVTAVDADSRQSYKVGLGVATKYIAPRVALIGDAAHQVHPIAGQGANLGFGDVRRLQDTLHEAISSGSDIGSSVHLLLYEYHCQWNTVPIISAVDLTHWHFNTTFTPIVAFRSALTEFINANRRVQEFLMTSVN